jgi:hypothetical protein
MVALDQQPILSGCLRAIAQNARQNAKPFAGAGPWSAYLSDLSQKAGWRADCASALTSYLSNLASL